MTTFRLVAPAVRSAIVLLVLPLVGCISRTIGATASTVAPGQQRTSATTALAAFVERRELGNGTIEKQVVVLPSILEVETRLGVTPRSDVGLRITGISEAVLSYKYRAFGSATGAAVAAQINGGVSFGGVVPTAGVSVIASSDDARRTAVYGGARFQAFRPLVNDSDLSALGSEYGGFFGLQLRRGSLVILPEIGVLRGNTFTGGERTLMLLPAVTFRRARMP
jgi:hypothetical protein